jgi:hypothetical protein
VRLTALALTAALLPAQEPAPPAVPAPVPAPAPVSAPAPAPRPPVDAPKLDEGLLDPAWFGEAVPFAKGDDVDFFWVKPGLDLTGRTVWMKPWDDPAMLRKGRDGKDHAKATALTDSFPGMLRGALSGAVNGRVKVSRSEGDVVLLGRFVDANAGSKAAKWLIGLGAGSETATWDLKLVDAKTGELLVALHHRAISGTAMSSIDDKLVKWADKFGTFMVQKTLK